MEGEVRGGGGEREAGEVALGNLQIEIELTKLLFVWGDVSIQGDVLVSCCCMLCGFNICYFIELGIK